MSSKYRKVREPLTPQKQGEIERRQAEERQRRGFRVATRPEKAEELLGYTPSENKLNSAQRMSQIKRKR